MASKEHSPDVYPADRRFYDRYADALRRRDLDPLRLWQSFVQFKALPTVKVATKRGAAYSASIEGNDEGLNELEREMRQRTAPSWWKANDKQKQRVEDLEAAYEFAQGRVLNEKNFLEAHGILAANLPFIEDHECGQYRVGSVTIETRDKAVVYEGASAEIVEEEMSRFFDDVAELRKKELTVEESFYHAALCHLVLEAIHPFADGNGRAGRLLEKWLLADQRGTKAWKLPTEEYYRKNLQAYYDAFPKGAYENVEYANAPALLTLPVEGLRFGRRKAEMERDNPHDAAKDRRRTDPAANVSVLI